MKVKLFLNDFRAMVRNQSFGSETNLHPIFFFENESKCLFYKPINSIVYWIEVIKSDLPADITLENLKYNEFNAIEILEPI